MQNELFETTPGKAVAAVQEGRGGGQARAACAAFDVAFLAAVSLNVVTA